MRYKGSSLKTLEPNHKLGADNRALLAELGYGETEAAALLELGVVGQS